MNIIGAAANGDIVQFTASDARPVEKQAAARAAKAFSIGPQTDLGSVSGNVTIDVSQTSEVKLTVGGNVTLASSGWPKAGFREEVELELVNGAAHTITWPTINWVKGDGTNSTTFADMGVTLASSGTNFVVIWSSDGGATLYGAAA